MQPVTVKTIPERITYNIPRVTSLTKSVRKRSVSFSSSTNIYEDQLRQKDIVIQQLLRVIQQLTK